MNSRDNLEIFKAIVDDAFRNATLKLRQSWADDILYEAHKRLTRKEFQELEKYVFERLEK